MSQELPGKMVWLDEEVVVELERAVEQGVMGTTVNEVLRQILRLPRGVFSHPTVRSREPKVAHSKDW
jgi:hypothetical protein